jgi:hypothetical protein
MSEEYDRMISLALHKEPVLDYQSRTALDKELSELGVKVQKAVEEQKWLDAKEWQERLDEMEILGETRLHDLPTLTSLVESVKFDQKLAIQRRILRQLLGYKRSWMHSRRRSKLKGPPWRNLVSPKKIASLLRKMMGRSEKLGSSLRCRSETWK